MSLPPLDFGQTRNSRLTLSPIVRNRSQDSKRLADFSRAESRPEGWERRVDLQQTTRLEAAQSNIASNIIGGGLAAISSTALFFWVLFYFSPSRYIRVSVQTSADVTAGHPLWETFQSRVLGPYLIEALSFGLSRNYVAAYICFQIITVAIAGFLCWRLGRKYGGGNQGALLALMIFIFCFVLLLSPPMLYSWDLIDLIVFAVFIELALSRRPTSWFIVLFAISIWNRDSAFFIALWLIFDPIIRWLYQRRNRPLNPALDWRRIVAAIACIVAGLIIVHALKETLTVEHIDHGVPFVDGSWGARPVSHGAGGEYNFSLFANIKLLKHSLFTPWFFILVPFVPTAILLGAAFARLDPERYLALYLVELSMLAGCFLFGDFGELRIYLIMVPFIVISGIVVVSSRSAVKQRIALGLPASRGEVK